MMIVAFDRALTSGTKQHYFSDHEDSGRVVARDVRMMEGKERIIKRVSERDGRDGKWDATEFCDQEKRQRWIIVRTASCDQFSRMFRAFGAVFDHPHLLPHLTTPPSPHTPHHKLPAAMPKCHCQRVSTHSEPLSGADSTLCPAWVKGPTPGQQER